MSTQDVINRWAQRSNASPEERERMQREAAERCRRMQLEDSQRYNATRGNLNEADGFDCPACLNRGMIMAEDGSIRFCACRSTRKALSRLRKLGLGAAAKSLTFGAFIASAPWQQKLLDTAQAYAAQERPGWLFIGGQSGCGKTHLCTAAAVALCHRGMDLHYMRWMNDSARLKSLSMDERRTLLLSEFIDAPLLYIDDFFKSVPTEADKHLAFELLCARYDRDDRPTIISCERTLPELFDIDEALAGRIAERCGSQFLLSIGRDRTKNYRLSRAVE